MQVKNRKKATKLQKKIEMLKLDWERFWGAYHRWSLSNYISDKIEKRKMDSTDKS